MFYIQLIGNRRDHPEFPGSRGNSTAKSSGADHKSAKFALLKTTKYIRHAQQLYYLDRGWFC